MVGLVSPSQIVGSAMELLRKSFPPVVRIETTNHCNAHCTFCPRDSIGRPKAFMTQELFEKIVDECALHDCPAIHMHNFGEPLLDRSLPARIRYCKDRGIRQVKIFCNGSLLKGAIAEELLESRLDEIKISIDGANAREFNELRVGLDHADVLENTRNFKQMRDKRGLSGPTITANCTVTTDKARTVELLKDVVDDIEYSKLHNWAGARKLFGYRKIRKPCNRLWRTLTILVNGDVSLCCLDYSGKELLGNCAADSIASIWNNERYAEVRRWHRTGMQRMLPLCNNCSKCFV